MYSGRTLFSQVMEFIPWTSFDRIVVKYGGDIGVRTLHCTEHFRAMAFAQITYRESLRDIEACPGSQPSKLYGMGLRGPVAKSTLADAIGHYEGDTLVIDSVYASQARRPSCPSGIRHVGGAKLQAQLR